VKPAVTLAKSISNKSVSNSPSQKLKINEKISTIKIPAKDEHP
jgi:hypothetical protein